MINSSLGKYYWKVLKLFLFALAMLCLTRLSLYFFNSNLFPNISFFSFIKIVGLGLIFDLAAFSMINIVFLPFFFLPHPIVTHRNYQKTLFSTFVTFNIVSFIPNFIDTAYFPFSGKRMTADFFSFIKTFQEDLLSTMGAMILSYWYLFLIFFVFVYFAFRWSFKLALNWKIKSRKFYIWQSFVLLFSIAAFIVFIRGGFRYRPLNIIDASKMVGSEKAALCLNSTFTLIKTYGKSELEIIELYDNAQLQQYFQYPYTPKSIKTRFDHSNVVVIIVESLNAEYMGCLNHNGESFTPFLDSLAKTSLVWNHTFSNSTRSVEGIPAVLSSFPVLQNTSFTYSQYSGNKYPTLASLLKKETYYSAFFHGGKKGTMGFNSYCLGGGFDSYYSMEDYPNKKDYDGSWGISDEPFLQYCITQMNTFPQPFVTSIFTLSSHHPYYIPPPFRGKLKKGKEPMLECINYVDVALRNFFMQASRQAWYDNTLFVITADHTSVHYDPKFSSYPRNMQIPVIFYAPKDTTLKGVIQKTTSQTDILPSILHWLGYTKAIPTFGRSVFDDTSPGFSLVLQNSIYKCISGNLIFETDLQGIEKFTLDTNFQSSGIEKSRFSHIVKALIQQYNNRMIQNKLLE